ncbi:MAG: galactokinase family protein [Longicatena sp.]
MNAIELKAKLMNGQLLERLTYLYVDEAMIAMQTQRYLVAIDKFVELYGDAREIAIYSAPGRSEVGGNHTDHQHGRVLAASVNLDTIAIVAKSEESNVRITSQGFNIKPVDISDLHMREEEAGSSEGLIRGVHARIVELGFQIGGFDAYMTSNVLEGAGLSSSAAFEVLLGTMISDMFNEGKIDSVEIAKIGQYAENKYFLKPCGLMDQCASSVGGFVTIDFENPEAPIVEKMKFDLATYKHSLCIIDTKGSHADLTQDYADITKEMKSVAHYFKKEYLREVSCDEFIKEISNVRETCGDRSVLRAYHFFEEDERVVQEVEALRNCDFVRFKQLVIASGNSSYKFLQNVYSPQNLNEQNISIALALSEYALRDRGASRVHGGGFAGTIQAFVPDELLTSYKELMEATFGKDSCYVLKIRPCGGVRVI